MSNTHLMLLNVPATAVNIAQTKKYWDERRMAVLRSINNSLKILNTKQASSGTSQCYGALILAVRELIADITNLPVEEIYPDLNGDSENYGSLMNVGTAATGEDSSSNLTLEVKKTSNSFSVECAVNMGSSNVSPSIADLSVNQFQILENVAEFLNALVDDKLSIAEKQAKVNWFSNYAKNFPGRILPGSNADNFDDLKENAVRKERLMFVAALGVAIVGGAMIVIGISPFLPIMPCLVAAGLILYMSGLVTMLGASASSSRSYYKGANFFANEAVVNANTLLSDEKYGLAPAPAPLVPAPVPGRTLALL